MILASRRVRQETLKWEASLFYTDCFKKTQKTTATKMMTSCPQEV